MIERALVVALEVIDAAHVQPRRRESFLVADLFRDFFDELIDFERLREPGRGKMQVTVLNELLPQRDCDPFRMRGE